MAIKTLRIKDLRCIQEADISPVKGINLIQGDNGSGKSSLLEAIYILGRGDTFKGKKSNRVIRDGSPYLELFGLIHRDSGLETKVGIRKAASKMIARINGQEVNRRSELARELDVQIITPQTHLLLSATPDRRRKIVDWGLFHVEHDYQNLSSRYQKALSQRNAALRISPEQSRSWEMDLAATGDKLEHYRKTYIKEIQRRFISEVNRFVDIDVSLKWSKGWDVNLSLTDALNKKRAIDEKRGFTSVGPHRADFTLMMESLSASKRASGGQQKLIMLALKLAIYAVSVERGQGETILLVDDIASELDRKNRDKVMQRLSEVGGQVFVTAIEGLGDYVSRENCMFHVEHGRFLSS